MKNSVIVVAVLLLALLASFVAFDFGGIAADYTLTTTKRDVRTDKDSPGQIAVILDNRSSRTMKILGLHEDCSCIEFDESLFPLTVPPRCARMFLLRVSGKTMTAASHIDCYVDTGLSTKTEGFEVSGHW